MDFAIRLDKDTKYVLPDLRQRDARVEVGQSELHVQLGYQFDLRTPIRDVTKVEPMADPEPSVFLPIGVSQAVEQLGRDTICVVGSQEGLVAVEFRDQVEAQVQPSRDAGPATIQMKRLILSLQDPDGFLKALQQPATTPS
jgi:hypothetical protein